MRRNEKKGRGPYGCVRDMLHVHTRSSGSRITSDAMARYRQCTKQAHNITAHPTFATLRGQEARPHCPDTVLHCAVT